MPFDLNNLGKVSTSANTDALQVWTYNATATGTNEAVATVIASGYFDDVVQNLTTGEGLFQVGDAIHVHATDAHSLYVVTAVTTAVTVAAYT